MAETEGSARDESARDIICAVIAVLIAAVALYSAPRFEGYDAYRPPFGVLR